MRVVLSRVGTAAVLLGLGLAGVFTASPARADGPGPWARTETRTPCASFNLLRHPYFGETHVHTVYSVDASIFDVRNTPRDAYRFATGEEIGLTPYDAEGHPRRTLRLRRPLDFAAVTDHSEGFGESYICFTPGEDGYDSDECTKLRNAIVQGEAGDLTTVGNTLTGLLIPIVALPAPHRWSFCGDGGSHCLDKASIVWDDIRAAAEEFYDRSAACTFTSFVGYEWSGTPLGNNLHRNVIFRNDDVPALPVSYIEQPTPQGLWAVLGTACQQSLSRCDWLAIPHNSNMSSGRMFLPENADHSPLTAADAAVRAASEPLVEIYQAKSSSECKPAVGTPDELCAFESTNRVTLFGNSTPTNTFAPLSFVRNALKEGLKQEQAIEVNPFRLGLIAATDNHNGIPGGVREDEWTGHAGVLDADAAAPYPGGRLDTQGRANIEDSPGGLAVVWAEENSRDAIFAAMRRREVYGTSGTRPIVRFFAGRYPKAICSRPDLVEMGYRQGVPMGGEIGTVDRHGPTFIVLASKDPGEEALPGTPLQRIQIVKGWIDANGDPQEKVVDVVGDPNNGASVDSTTCTPTGAGFDTLCATWTDPEFDVRQRAFYYARVLENPSCRWSTYACNSLGVDCTNPDMVPADLQGCCSASVPKTIQERAWASPIWYRPEGIGRLKATLHYHAPGADTLRLVAHMGPGLAARLATQDFQVVVRDDDVILDATIPAGTFAPSDGGFAVNDPTGHFGGVQQAIVEPQRAGQTIIRISTIGMDLSRADRTDHAVEVEIRIGTLVASHTRLWRATSAVLRTR
ncbi:MAG: DUF3604 domain-containing protein [Deltaproteobacteria bacterium]|nr:MAG: DUF3604 domain-containing protein [Deltaproteobacteria bacterium]